MVTSVIIKLHHFKRCVKDFLHDINQIILFLFLSKLENIKPAGLQVDVQHAVSENFTPVQQDF